MEPNEILKAESNRRSNWGDQIKQSERSRAVEAEELNLFILLGCTLLRDGNQWCVLYGKDLQEGIAGFGDSPMKAIWDFNKQFKSTIEKRAPEMFTGINTTLDSLGVNRQR